MQLSFNLLSQPVAEVKLTARSVVRPALLGLIAVVGAGIGSPAQAQQTQPVHVTQPDAESLRIRINNSTGKPAVLRVVNLTKGNTILYEIHREPAYGTLLKFNTLSSGRYAVVLSVGPNRYRYNVQVDSQKPGGTTIAVSETMSRRVESGLATASL
ncbi:hypothetical protein [Hymenobacter arizonensis]|uniref:Uncharacterized protein n=1 Tax=Hymenobacter arizonensis TaxID=1227077 RepID=A0A1I6AZN2_HYMAR|nr:hypothetical protein [Hymenobacter arizonensis]SFQ74120.1 hypothetical protein SAMN04515668_4092 [Hymenobacter arizonensis]